jgi:hypothetical protein
VSSRHISNYIYLLFRRVKVELARESEKGLESVAELGLSDPTVSSEVGERRPGTT